MNTDEQAIANLLYRYADLVDAGDFDGVGRLLGHAVLTDQVDRTGITGADAIAARYTATTRRYDDGTPRTKHLVTNVAIEVGADQAEARSAYSVFQQVGDFPLQVIIQGRYQDRFDRVGGSWRFSARHIVVDLLGDLSRHLTFDLDGSL